MQIDIGFGDTIVPEPTLIDYPCILILSAPVLLGYPRETVVAEKLHALTEQGTLNSRLKDYFDIALLSRLYSLREFEPIGLRASLAGHSPDQPL